MDNRRQTLCEAPVPEYTCEIGDTVPAQTAEHRKATILPREASLWRLLRRPFALTPAMGSVHKCQWEKIDMGLLGCTTCSAIHVCSIDTCPSIQSQDATVCLLSGLCLTNTNFVQEQYSDRKCVAISRIFSSVIARCPVRLGVQDGLPHRGAPARATHDQHPRLAP